MLTVIAAAWVMLAQFSDTAKLETLHLTATTSVRQARVAPGTRTALIIEIAPKPKMHVYAPQQDAYIPVSLTLKESRAFRAHAPTFPKPVKYFFVPLKETQLVYSEPFKIVQEITIASLASLERLGIQPGASLTIEGTLRYQACDDAICYLPQSVPVSWTVPLEKTSKSAQ
jgi:DsbC/DsbD-like thiol-disulfide interchange protein